jgi:hypothetical protein
VHASDDPGVDDQCLVVVQADQQLVGRPGVLDSGQLIGDSRVVQVRQDAELGEPGTAGAFEPRRGGAVV